MDRAAAASKITKLEALANDPAATPGEARTARKLAARLKQRHAVTPGDLPPPQPRRRPTRPPRPPAGGLSVFGSRAAFIKAFDDAMSDFDPNTGETRSDRVHVVYHRDRGNWRIDLDI